MKLIVVDEQICFGGNTHVKGDVLELGDQVGSLLLQKNKGLRVYKECQEVVVKKEEPEEVVSEPDSEISEPESPEDPKEEEPVVEKKEEVKKEEKKEEKKKVKKGFPKLFSKKKVK